MKNFLQHGRLLFLSLFVFCTLIGVQAQEMNVTGTVVDANDQSPIPGVSIQVKGSSRGGATDVNGAYSITANPGDVLIFSFIGYAKQEITVGSSLVIDVRLSIDVTELDEIVVIGYGTVKKEDATGAVATVTTEDFNKGVISSPQELLMGRTSGVQITTNGGAPGEGATIRIRGGSSLSASNDPLFIIDGIPVDNGGIAGMSNPLTTINPNDIATMTVLKDASATAIYGSRASNGVIIITTKRGEMGKPTVTYSGNVSISQIVNTVDVLNGQEMRDLVTERGLDNTNTTPAAAGVLLGSFDTDWQSMIYGNAISQDHNVALSGSIENMPYRASVGYTNQNGILKSSNMERVTGSLNLDPSFLDGDLKIKVNAKGSYSKHQFANQGAVGSAVTFDPTQSPYLSDYSLQDINSIFRDDEGTVTNDTWGGYFYWPQLDNKGNPITIAPSNPLAMLNLEDNSAPVYRIIANTEFDYSLPFVEGLSLKLNLATDRSQTNGTHLIFSDASYTWNDSQGNGRNTVYDQKKSNDLLEAYFNYSKDFGKKGSLNFLGGYSIQHFYLSENSSTTAITTGTNINTRPFKTESFLESIFGRINYEYNDFLIVTGTLRNDVSSKFAIGNRGALFPSGAIALKLTEFDFMAGQDLFSEIKLRAGVGITGQQNIVDNDYPAVSNYSLSDNEAQYQFGDDFVRLIRYEAYDSNLKWEETTTYNLGADFGIFQDRITASVDLYYRETTDLINYIPVPIGTNFTNFLTTNVGTLENKGLEFALDAHIIDMPDFKWDISYNITFNQNKITKLIKVNDPSYVGVNTGGISGGVGTTSQIHSVGFPSSTFFLYEQVYDSNGKPVEGLYVDQNGDGIINDLDRVKNEDPAPNTYMGFSNRLYYKDFDLIVNARMNVGNFMYNNVDSQYGTFQNLYNSAGYLLNVARSAFDSGFDSPQYLSDYYLSNASFFRIDNISLGYNLKKITQQNIAVRFTVQNALVVTKYKGLDPEVFSGIDNNIYPRPRTFMLGVTAKF